MATIVGGIGAFRGETLERFLATRKVPLTYSVAGGDKVRQIDRT